MKISLRSSLRALLLVVYIVGILVMLTTAPVLGAPGDVVGVTLTQFSDTLPGPSVEIDFSKGDWWVGLLFYMLIQWMRQRGGGNGSGR